MHITSTLRTWSTPPSGAPAAPAAAAPADAAAPQDQVSTTAAVAASPAPPATNPWPALERASLVGAARATPGPIGQALGQVGRQGLLDALVRLQSKGVTFERERSWFRVPFTAKHVPLSPEETLQRLESHGTKSLNVNQGGQQHTRLDSLDDVRDLDAVYGLGPDAAPTADRDATRALEDLTSAGWKMTQQYYDNVDASPFAALQSLRSGRANLQATGPGGAYRLSSFEDLVNVDYMTLGHDRGVKNAAVIAGVTALQQAGVELQGDRYYGDPTLSAIRTLAGGSEVRVNLPQSAFSLGVKAADLKAPADVKARLEASEAFWNRYFEPVVGRYEQYYGAPLLDFCQASDARFGTDMRAAVAASVLQVAQRDDLRNGAVEKATRRMENLAADDLQLAWIANRFAATARHEGMEGAMDMLSALDEGIVARTASRAEADRLRPILQQMIAATGSVAAANEGIDLVRIAIGSEPEEQRVRLFLDIAAHESEKTLDRTAADYRAVLVNRRPDEDLVSAGKTFVSVLQMLSLGRQQERAAEVFATLQDGLRQGAYGSRATDEVLAQFGQALTLGSSVDDAMASLRGHGRTGGVPAGPSTVKHDDDAVVIGGVRVPRARPTASAEA